MVFHIPGKQESQFLMTHLPLLLKRFSLFYEQDGLCLEYFLYSKEKKNRISKTLVVSHDLFSRSLYIAKFYPEIFREMNCKYLSAACFYLMAHHAVKRFHLADNCCVNLETDLTVFKNFYGRLNDFAFKIHYHRPSEKVRLKGHYHEISFGTHEILHHIPACDGE
jgi:hypothetical protein